MLTAKEGARPLISEHLVVGNPHIVCFGVIGIAKEAGSKDAPEAARALRGCGRGGEGVYCNGEGESEGESNGVEVEGKVASTHTLPASESVERSRIEVASTHRLPALLGGSSAVSGVFLCALAPLPRHALQHYKPRDQASY